MLVIHLILDLYSGVKYSMIRQNVFFRQAFIGYNSNVY